MNKEFIATNKLEKSLIDANNGKIQFPEFIRIFIESELIIPSAAEKQADGSIVPLFFKKESQSMLSIFTSASLLDMYKENIKYYLTLKGKDILMQIPVGNGLVINPGYSVGCDISVDGIKNIINDFIAN